LAVPGSSDVRDAIVPWTVRSDRTLRVPPGASLPLLLSTCDKVLRVSQSYVFSCGRVGHVRSPYSVHPASGSEAGEVSGVMSVRPFNVRRLWCGHRGCLRLCRCTSSRLNLSTLTLLVSETMDDNDRCSRSLKNPALQLLQKSSKSASTTSQRPIWNTFGTVAVREFWENGCNNGLATHLFRG